MSVTLKHIAEEVGVSYQTVWRAIHDMPGIRPDTRSIVLKAASRLGYRPNRLAGSLRTQQSATIGLVVLDVRAPHAGEVIIGVEAEAAGRGLSVLLANTGGDPNREHAAIASLLERRVDGIILIPSGARNGAALRRMLPKGLPFVAVNRGVNGMRSHTVLSRNADAGRVARYLAERGHRSVATLFGDLTITPLRERHAAFSAAASQYGISLPAHWQITGENSTEFGRQSIRKLLRRGNRPDALFAATSGLTEGVLYGLYEAGIRHGKDIVLVGFDFRHATLLDPVLPVLLQRSRDMGRLAVDILTRLQQGLAVDPVHYVPIDGLET
jgi:LacI family transcriptional regulator